MNKKIIPISLLVIMAVIAVSGCLGLSEDERYNNSMSDVYEDIKLVNEALNNTSDIEDADNDTLKEFNKLLTDLNGIIDNDTKELKDLDESITNDTRKEYIKICIKELDEIKKSIDLSKQKCDVVMKSNPETIGDVLTKLAELDLESSKHTEKIEELDKQRQDYEKKYPFVLINGTTSVFNNNTGDTNNTN